MRVKSALTAVLVVASAIVLPAHGQDSNRPGSPTAKVVVRGAGATFPAPLYEKWIMTFRKQNPDLVITYDVVGSGEGEKRFLATAVDFGASDAALRDEQLPASSRAPSLFRSRPGWLWSPTISRGLAGTSNSVAAS
jgi:phosphate transport system substrate-binding protein